MACAVLSASSIRSAAGTIRATSPARSASVASIIRPVRHISIALALPTARGEPLRSAHAGRDAQLDLGLAEFRAIGGNDEIGHHRKLAAAAQREAGDGRDPRLAGGGDLAGPVGENIVGIE